MKCYRIITDHSDERQLQSDLSSLNSRSSNHFMNFNIKKCKHLAITKRKNILQTSYNLNGWRITDVTTEKDLGVHISSTLSWNDHIDLIIRGANKMLGLIYRRCTNECDQLTLLTLYKSLVAPQLEYAAQVCSPYTKGKIMAIERVQRRATKVILKCHFSITYPERLVKLGLLPLEFRSP